jgi:hypothetical protein
LAANGFRVADERFAGHAGIGEATAILTAPALPQLENMLILFNALPG